MSEEKKIIIDDDWKAQARAEKEKLSAAAKSEKAAASAEQSSGDQQASSASGEDKKRQLPESSIQTIISMMTTQAMFAMGAAPDPSTGQRYMDLDMARFQIDNLAVLQEKTEGNLTDDEKKLLTNTLYELRSHFIAVTRQVNSQSVAGQG